MLCIKNGASLNDNDFIQIKKFLSKSNGDVIIAKDERDVTAFKKAAHITDKGSREVFADTDESKLDIKQYGPNDSKFIRSRLPLRHASKIGVSSLKTKPIRLIFTIILCTVAFVLFGLLSTLTFYDSEAMFKQTLSDTNRDFVVLENNYLATIKFYENGEYLHEYEDQYPAKFSAKDIEALSDTFGKDIFGAASAYGMEFNIRSRTSDYWYNTISAIAYLPEGNAFRNKISGNYPQNDDEICISRYSAEMLIASQATDRNGKIIDANTPNDLIGKSIIVSGEEFKVVGIFDCGELDPKFEELKTNTERNYSLLNEFEFELNDGTYLLTFFSEQTFKNIANKLFKYSASFENDTPSFGTLIIPNVERREDEYPNYRYRDASILTSSEIFYFDSQKTTLNDNEIIIPQESWLENLYTLLDNKYNTSENLTEEEYKRINALRTDIDFIRSGEKYDLSENGEITNQRPLVKAEREEIIKRLLAEFGNIPFSFSLTPADSDYLKIGDPTTYTVVGIALDSEYGIVYITKAEYKKHWENQFKTFDFCTVMETNYVSDNGTSYSLVYAPFTDTAAQKDMLWDIHENKDFNENSTRISLGGMYISELDMIDELVQSLSKVFLYVGLAFAAFAILLFSNFISTSISQKKREIGILRAVGARGTDVFKIFFSESFVIAFICSIISIIGTTVVCSALNTSIATELGASIFVFGPFSILIIIGTALITAILATFVPVWIAARKKPVESIRSI